MSSAAPSAILIRADQAGVKTVAVPGLEVPTDGRGQFWVYFNKHDPARSVSATDVLNGRVAPDRLRGRLVLIGTSATGLLDIKTTPVQPDMPGVEVHAQILENILTKSLLASPGYAIGAEIIAAVVFRPRHHRSRADAAGGDRGRARRHPDRGSDRHLLVLLCRAPSVDRLHLSADLVLAHLSGAHLRELLPRAAAAAADSLRLRILPVAAAGRATGAARRRSSCSAAKSAA